MSLEDKLAKPPEPPRTRRAVRLRLFQWIGIPLVLVLPVALAAAGVFGESWETTREHTSSLDVTVRWPTRFRYKQLNDLRVWVHNRTATPIDTVHVSVDTAYANRFSTVRAIPGFDEPYSLSLVSLRPGERRLALIEIQAEQYGIHSGAITVAAGDTARLAVRTIIFP